MQPLKNIYICFEKKLMSHIAYQDQCRQFLHLLNGIIFGVVSRNNLYKVYARALLVYYYFILSQS